MLEEVKTKKKRVLEEEDFIDCKKYKDSVKRLLEKYPEGIDDDTMAKILLMNKEEITCIYNNSVLKFRKALNVSEEDLG